MASETGEYFESPGAVLFIDGEREFTLGERMRASCADSGVRAPPVRRESEGVIGPLIQKFHTARRTKRVRRRVVEVFWPFAFSGSSNGRTFELQLPILVVQMGRSVIIAVFDAL